MWGGRTLTPLGFYVFSFLYREHVCRIDLAVHVTDANDVPSLEFLEKAYAAGNVSKPFDRRCMWPVRVARSPHLDMAPEVVWAGAQRQRPYDKDVLKNKDFLNRRLYSTIRSDHQHGPNAMSRCAYVLVGFG